MILFRDESLKLYTVLYMQDIVVKDTSCMQVYLGKALLMKEKKN